MDKLLHIESQYSNLLSKYEDQIKVNNELRSEIEGIRQELSTYKNSNISAATPVSAPQNPDGIYQEVLRRQARMNNIVIFNLNLEDDIPKEVQVASLLSDGPTHRIEVRNVVIVGNPNRNGHKPVKVTLSNSSDVSYLLRNRKLYIDSYQIYIEADLSPSQLKYLQDTKEELRRRRSNGEENLILRYIAGVPTITTKNLVPPATQTTS